MSPEPRTSATGRQRWKGCFGAGLIVFLGLQALPLGRLSVSPPISASELQLSEPLAAAVRRACFDCHASERPLPWYGRVAPLSWWMSREKRWAQGAVDFSRWSDYTPRQQRLIWQRSLLRVSDGTMSPPRYHLVHPELSPQDLIQLRRHLDFLKPSLAQQWASDEMFAWPAGEWSGGPVTGVVRAKNVALDHPLVMAGGLLLVDGTLRAPFGIQGHGAIFCDGEIVIEGLQASLGPLWLLGKSDVAIRATRPVVWEGLVSSAGRLSAHGVQVTEVADLSLSFADVREDVAHFCRDDGELGEFAERMLVARYKDGEYVLWDPEFAQVRRAVDVEGALGELEALLAQSPATDLKVWRSRLREPWRVWLTGLAAKGAPARLRSNAAYPPLGKPGTENSEASKAL